MPKMPRALVALTATIIGAGLVAVGTPAAAQAAVNATITPSAGTTALTTDGFVEVRFTAQVILPESTPQFPVSVALTGGWGSGGEVPVQSAGGTCSPAVLPAAGDYTITCVGQTDEPPAADVVDLLSRVSLSYPSQWGYPMMWTQADVLTRYSAAPPPVVEPPVVDPPVVDPPVVDPPVVDPPVVDPPVVDPPVVAATTVECIDSVYRFRRTPATGREWFLNQTVKAGAPGRYCGTNQTDRAVFATALRKDAARRDAATAVKAHRTGKQYLAPGVHGWKYIVKTSTCALDAAGNVTTCEAPKVAASSQQTIRVGRKDARFLRAKVQRHSSEQVENTNH